MIVEKCSCSYDVHTRIKDVFVHMVKSLLKNQELIRIAIATGDTFLPFLESFSSLKLPFERMDLFLVDEYAGVDPTDERSCSIDLFNAVNCLDQFHSVNSFSAKEYTQQIKLYNATLKNHPLDILLLGFGEDGHFAFCNHIDDTRGKAAYSLVRFSEADLMNQVKRGWFSCPDIIPKEGITLTSVGVLQSRNIILAGFGEKKRNIIDALVSGTVRSDCPLSLITYRKDIVLITD